MAVSAVLAVEPGEVRIRTGPYLPVPAPTLSVQTTLVESGVTIRNRRGASVGGFTRNDFEILDNGKAQDITAFSELKATHAAEEAFALGLAPAATTAPREATPPALPRTIALYFDDSHASQFAIAQAKRAAARFFESGLGPVDRVGIFTDSGKVAQDFTNDRRALEDALAKVQTHRQPGPRTIGVCPDVTPYESYAVSHHIDVNAEQQLIDRAIACNCHAPDDKECPALQPGLVENLTASAWNQFKQNSVTSLEALAKVVRHCRPRPEPESWRSSRRVSSPAISIGKPAPSSMPRCAHTSPSVP